ncbi:MAG: FemAB family XrtA/PEP-CTERM system-associated protein [Acidobacteriota bacterium]
MPAAVVEKLTPEVGSEWDAYVQRHPDGRSFHRAGWAAVIRHAMGREPLYRLARIDGQIAGIMPLVRFAHPLFGRYLVAAPFLERGGILASSAEAREALGREAIRLLGDTGSSFCELRQLDSDPLPGLELPGRKAALRHKVTYSLRVDMPEEALWKHIGFKVRNRIRRAERCGLSARLGDPQRDLEAFYLTFAHNMHRLGTPVYPRRFFAEIFRQFPEDTFLVLVEDRERTASAALVIADGREAEGRQAVLHWSGSRREYLPAAPNMLLYWKVMQLSAQRGLQRLSMGRSTEGSGPALFKRQWRTEKTALRWDYLLPERGRISKLRPESSRFRAAAAVWRRLPFAWTLRLGPPIVRHLP